MAGRGNETTVRLTAAERSDSAGSREPAIRLRPREVGGVLRPKSPLHHWCETARGASAFGRGR